MMEKYPLLSYLAEVYESIFNKLSFFELEQFAPRLGATLASYLAILS